jgi:Uma2 family endonuclease
MCALPHEQDIEYPTSDGQPMAETTLHREVMSNLIGGLERRYAEVPDVWVGGNLLLYYEQGNPEKSVSPDVLLTRGIAKWARPIYLLWDEKPPTLVFEITSRRTRKEDTGPKKALYERLGVAELVLFDPYGEYLKPRLQGYRLERGRYQPIAPNPDGSLSLRTTGLTARPEGGYLRLVDSASGEKLLWHDELEAARRAAEVRAVTAEVRAVTAEVRAVTAEERAVTAEVRAVTAEEGAAREAAARRAAEERAAAAEERSRALAEELARLRRGGL